MTINTIIAVIADPGEAEIVASALQIGALEGRCEPGCLHYEIFRNTRDDHHFLIKKSHDSKSALGAHIATKKYHDLVASVADICHIQDYLEVEI
jgi:quinol monooxygenase YgiN